MASVKSGEESGTAEADTVVDMSKIGNSIKKPKEGLYDTIPLFQEMIQRNGTKELEEVLVFENFL